MGFRDRFREFLYGLLTNQPQFVDNGLTSLRRFVWIRAFLHGSSVRLKREKIRFWIAFNATDVVFLFLKRKISLLWI
jgi:hypothetical protein